MTQAVNKELKKYSPPRPDPPDSIFDTAEDPTSAVTELCKKLFDEADADNSGELDEEELANLTKKLFDEIDNAYITELHYNYYYSEYYYYRYYIILVMVIISTMMFMTIVSMAMIMINMIKVITVLLR